MVYQVKLKENEKRCFGKLNYFVLFFISVAIYIIAKVFYMVLVLVDYNNPNNHKKKNKKLTKYNVGNANS